ncbi:MAG: hypothetical protein IKE21_01215 [Erysipelotrichaceae bacterium]|nr:hypothetical protein [Erysipelotrichaceae bacterium]
MKKVLSVILAVFMLAAISPMNAFAEETTKPETPIDIDEVVAHDVNTSKQVSISTPAATYYVTVYVNGVIYRTTTSGPITSYSLNVSASPGSVYDVSYAVSGNSVIVYFTVYYGGYTTSSSITVW